MLLLALVITGSGYSVLAPAPPVVVADQDPAQARHGAELFRNSCVSCHGANLEGVEGRGPSLLALVVVHLALVWYQKHTQFPGVRRTEHNVVGVRIPPVFVVKSGAFFVAVLGLMAGLLRINPVWLFGPYNVAHVSAGSQPDWYIGWLDGSSRLWPPWDPHLGNHVVPAQFWPTAVLPLMMITLAAVYPWLEGACPASARWRSRSSACCWSPAATTSSRTSSPSR